MQQSATTPPADRSMHISFRQKSIGVSLIVVASSTLYYGVKVAAMLPTTQLIANPSSLPAGFVPLVLGLVFCLVIVEVVLQTVLAFGAGQVSAATPQEQTIARKAMSNAYMLLVTGMLATIGGLFFGTTQFFAANLLIIAFMLAEIVRLATQLVYYRQIK